MPQQPPAHPDAGRLSGPTRTVRPRWVWGGLVALLLGLAAVGWAIIDSSITWTAIGVVVLVVGAVASLRGGLLYDVDTTFAPGQEAGEVGAGEPHVGPTSRARIHDPAAQARAREVTARTRRLTRATASAPRPSSGPIGILVILLVCLWLLVAQWALIPVSTTGRGTGLRDLGVAVVVALAAFRLRAGRSQVAVALCLLGGLSLVIFALFAGHDAERTGVNEAICGVLIILGAALTLDRGTARSGSPRVAPAMARHRRDTAS